MTDETPRARKKPGRSTVEVAFPTIPMRYLFDLSLDDAKVLYDELGTAIEEVEEAGEEDPYRVGPVCLDAVGTVIGEYDYYNRWNGWLNPFIDAWSVVKVLDALNADPEYYQEYGIDWDFNDEGHLVLTERQWAAEDPEDYEPEVLEPNEDGLYGLGYFGWTWSEDTTFFRSDEWKAWDEERSHVWVAASNAKNAELHAAPGGFRPDRHAQEKAAQEAVAEWMKTHPEPNNTENKEKMP